MVFTTGVIEGFYGRPWPWAERTALLSELARWGLDSYIYAPKSDRQLRRAWRQTWADDHAAAFGALRDRAAALGIRFGVGFSPWGMQTSFGAADARALKARIAQLNAFELDWLAILFDDMPGEGAGLADRQADIVETIMVASNARRFAMCPSWYSDDPQLAALFGPMPSGYLERLGQRLPPAVEVFWTGPQVVSTHYAASHFADVSAALRRRPLLWDNYPVNDGRKISRFLHLLPLSGRPQALREWCSGHLLNPMNQPLLSRPALASQARLYQLESDAAPAVLQEWWREALPALVGPATARLLVRDAERFQRDGLDALAAAERSRLCQEYGAVGEPAAREVVEWLQEGYRFDPGCLND